MQEDEFEITAYIEGLGEFIMACQTPMTVAIQGDWGCGKTSMMNMMRDYLMQKDCIHSVWFNTWQFSQFNMDKQLTITFLQHFVKEIEKGINERDSRKKAFAKEAVSKVSKFVRAVAKNSNDFVDGIITDMEDSLETKDLVDEISSLRKDFSKLIEEVTKDDDKRFVIFIDDLDRLQPVYAVELLEVLKIFVDCEKCIFVLAIDTSVVFQGIREKYGSDISPEKAQSFFDKMIQLPFKMPIANYHLENTIKKMLCLEEKKCHSKERDFIRLVKMTSEGNPRSIKRIVNFYLLTEKVAESKKIFDSMDDDKISVCKIILLAFSCIQLKYEDLYYFILNDSRNSNIDKLKEISINVENRRDVNERYDKIIKSFEKIGASKINVEEHDKLNFVEIITIFIQNCMEIFTWENARLNSDNRKIVISLLRLTSLNESQENIGENDVNDFSSKGGIMITDENEIEEFEAINLFADDSTKTEELAQIKEELKTGLTKHAYEVMMKNGIYPIVTHSNIVDDNEMELYAVNAFDSDLLQYISDGLAEHYDIKMDSDNTGFSAYLGDERIVSVSVYRRRIDATPGGWYEKCTSEKNYYDDIKKMFIKLIECQGRLAAEYGESLFPKLEVDLRGDEVENYEFYKWTGLFLYSKEMANIFIDVMISIAALI